MGYPVAFCVGCSVEIPLGQRGLVVDFGPTGQLRLVQWRHPMTGNVMEALLPIASLHLIALPSYPPLNTSEKP